MKLHRFGFLCSVLALAAVAGNVFASDFLEETAVTYSVPEPAPVQPVAVKIEKTVTAAPAQKIPGGCGDTCYEKTETFVQTVPPTNPKMKRVASNAKLKTPGNCGKSGCAELAFKPTPQWYGTPKARNTNRELVKTVDINGVPWWDDSVSHHDKTDYADDFVYEVNPDGHDWKWWVDKKYGPAGMDGFPNNGGRAVKSSDRAWDANVDYPYFEYMTIDELENRRALAAAGGYIDPWVEYYDKRSCPPWMDLDSCKQWMDAPHFVEDLPAVAPQTLQLSEHDRYTARAVEELFLNPQTPNSYWVNGMAASASDNVEISLGTSVPAAPAVYTTMQKTPTVLAAPVAPSVALLSDFDAVPVASFVDAPSSGDRFIRDDVAMGCREPGQTIAVETCSGTKCVECPFDTTWECEIWLNKPHVKEAVVPRSKKLRQVNVDSLVALLRAGNTVSVDMRDAAPLVKRYEKLMDMSRACCTEGIVYNLQRAGATPGLVYKFLVDDANFYGFGDRCLMMTDTDLDRYRNTATAGVIGDVRNGCLCRQKEWFKSLLAPFQQVGEQVPNFSSSSFNYTYTDGLNREVTTSINTDVKNVLWQLEQCP